MTQPLHSLMFIQEKNEHVYARKELYENVRSMKKREGLGWIRRGKNSKMHMETREGDEYVYHLNCGDDFTNI